MTANKKSLGRQLARVWIALVGAYFLWEAANYRRFYAWLAEWQIANFGGYVPLLNFIALLFIGWLPIWVIRKIVRARNKNEQSAQAKYDRLLVDANRLRVFLLGGAIAALGGLLATLALAFILVPRADGPVQSLAASEFGTTTIAEGPTRVVGGELGTIISFGQDWQFSENRNIYAPYRSTSMDKEPNIVFIKLSVGKSENLTRLRSRPAWSGILVRGGMPGTIRSLFGSVGVKIANPHFTLYPDLASIRSTYWVQAGQLALLVLLLLFLGWRQSKRVAKLRETDITSHGDSKG